eukprot:SAG31_NODE_10167_length_1175_cov_5.153346_1_plen_142_part_01
MLTDVFKGWILSTFDSVWSLKQDECDGVDCLSPQKISADIQNAAVRALTGAANGICPLRWDHTLPVRTHTNESTQACERNARGCCPPLPCVLDQQGALGNGRGPGKAIVQTGSAQSTYPHVQPAPPPPPPPPPTARPPPPHP